MADRGGLRAAAGDCRASVVIMEAADGKRPAAEARAEAPLTAAAAGGAAGAVGLAILAETAMAVAAFAACLLSVADGVTTARRWDSKGGGMLASRTNMDGVWGWERRRREGTP